MIKMSITANTISSWLQKRIEKLKESEELFEKIGSMVSSSIVKRIKEGVEPSDAPLTKAVKRSDKTLRDTGRLMGSITYKAGRTFALVGTNVEYARILNDGGVIKPKRAKWLTLPASNNTRKLMRRYGETPKKCIERMKADGYSVFVPKGKHVIMAKRKKSKPFVLFILKKEVEIPKRPYMTIDEKEKKIIKEQMREWLAF